MENREHYQFIRSLRIPTSDSIDLKTYIHDAGRDHKISLIDFNYNSLSFYSENQFTVGQEIRIELLLKQFLRKTEASIKITILRTHSTSGGYFYGATVNNSESQNYLSLVHHYISLLNPAILKKLIFKNTFEIRDISKEEAFYHFQIFAGAIKQLPKISISEYIKLIKKFAPFAKTEMIEREVIISNKNLLEVSLTSRFKINRFSDVTKWLIGFEENEKLLSISIENRYLGYHQLCNNFFKICYSKLKLKKKRNDFFNSIAYSSNIMCLQGPDQAHMLLKLKESFEKNKKLQLHEFELGEHIPQSIFKYIDISKHQDVLVINIEKITQEHEFILLVQKIKKFKGYKIIILSDDKRTDLVRHYFEQVNLIGSTLCPWKFVLVNSSSFMNNQTNNLSIKNNEDAQVLNTVSLPPEQYKQLLEKSFKIRTA